MDESTSRNEVVIVIAIIFALLLIALAAYWLGDSCFLGDACDRGVKATEAFGRDLLRIQLTEMAK